MSWSIHKLMILEVEYLWMITKYDDANWWLRVEKISWKHRGQETKELSHYLNQVDRSHGLNRKDNQESDAKVYHK